MESFTVHKINEELTVALQPLPGFRNLGSCVVRDQEGKRAGLIQVYFVGKYFNELRNAGDFNVVEKEIRTLAKNAAIKRDIGGQITRLNLSSVLRNKLRKLINGESLSGDRT